MEQGLQRCVLSSSLFNIFFVAFVDVAYTRFKADKDTMDAPVHLRKRPERRGGEGAAGKLTLATLLWGMLYAGDAGVLSQSPGQLRKMCKFIAAHV